MLDPTAHTLLIAMTTTAQDCNAATLITSVTTLAPLMRVLLSEVLLAVSFGAASGFGASDAGAEEDEPLSSDSKHLLKLTTITTIISRLL